MKLFLVRHGQSQYNLENRFTGLANPDLTPKGIAEAHETGNFLKHKKIDKAFVSELIRAQRTLDIILEEIGNPAIEVIQTKGLNPRDYGKLTGLNKADSAQKYGEEQVLAWRRSYKIPPPGGESLEETTNRIVPYFKEHIKPLLKEKNILLVAHGNTLRALIMYLENLTPKEIRKREVSNAEPVIYTF